MCPMTKPPYSDAMSTGEHVGHALSVTLLVVGGLFAKSVILNWIVGPTLVIVAGTLALSVESRIRGRRRVR